jgi:DNA-binding MarR family transcriptional regulator
VVLKLGRRLRQEGLKVGLSPLDAQLLAVIKVKPGLGVCDLADLEQMSRPAMSVHLKRLEGAGWLERRGGEGGDRRRRSLYLTPNGAAALSAIRRSRTDWLAARLQRLSDADREALRACLGPLVRLAEMKS